MKTFYNNLIKEFYSNYNRDNTPDIPKLLEKYKGIENELIRTLFAKYSANPWKFDFFRSYIEIYFKEFISSFYVRFNVEKLNQIDTLVEKYKDTKEEFIKQLCSKYSIEVCSLIDFIDFQNLETNDLEFKKKPEYQDLMENSKIVETDSSPKDKVDSSHPKKSFKKHLIIIIALFALCCVVSVGLYLFNPFSSASEVKYIPVKVGLLYQYIDRSGTTFINPQFAEAGIFRNGLALVQTSGEKPQWGYIGENGKFTIIARYKNATVFSEGIAWVVSENGAPTAINTKGEIKFSLQDAQYVGIFKEGLAPFSLATNEGEWKKGFVDTAGKVKITPQFTRVQNFSEQRCAVQNITGQWGFIDKEGNIVIDYQFDSIGSRFTNGVCVVFSNGKAGVIGLDGKFIINPQFSNIVHDGNIFKVEQNEKRGWIDKEGKVIISPQFSKAYIFNDEKLAAIESSGKWGYIDKKGEIIISPQFDNAWPFEGNQAFVNNGNKWGLIDKKGTYVKTPIYDTISPDYLSYIFGESWPSSVQTDFFDLKAIVSRLDLNAPEGITFSTPLSTILEKFKKTKSDFSTDSSKWNMLFERRSINLFADFSFGIKCSAYTSDGYDSIFNNTSTPRGFGYIINFTDVEKQKNVRNAIENSLIGYSKDTLIDRITYKGDKQNVTFWNSNEKQISITIFLSGSNKP